MTPTPSPRDGPDDPTNGSAQRAAAVRCHPLISYRMFLLEAGAEETTLDLVNQDPGVPDFVRGGPGGAVFVSAGNDFYPIVDLELWTGPPPAPQGEWDRAETVTVPATNGRLQLREMHGTRLHDPLMGPADEPMLLQVHCRGRTEARARLGPPGIYHGVEEWLLRIWPARTGATSGPEPRR